MIKMKLIKTKTWLPIDIACLKWSSIFLGMIAGAYFPEFIRHYVWIFAVVFILLAIKPIVSYFRNDQ